MKITSIILGLLLLLSNGWWFYKSLDTGNVLSYRDEQIHELDETRKQLMNMLPAISGKLSKQEIIKIASSQSNEEPFEEGGCTWIEWIGFKFNDNEKLQSVSPSWSYGGHDPCFPDNK